MGTIEQNRATLQRWYNEMWGQCNNALIPQIAAPHYLRHDITGANNRMTSEQYRDLVGLGLAGESVREFEYFLVAEGDYVASLGRYVLNSGRQWDWVQLFRLENAAMVETWLPGMGGTDPFGYPQPHNVWTGTEIPPPLPLTPRKRVVQSLFVDVWAGGQFALLDELLAGGIRLHDHTAADCKLTAAGYAALVEAKLAGRSVHGLQLFMIEEGDFVVAVACCKAGDSAQWDFVQAFRFEDLRIAESWLPAIGGNDTSLQHDAATAWPRGVMPAGSVRLP